MGFFRLCICLAAMSYASSEICVNSVGCITLPYPAMSPEENGLKIKLYTRTNKRRGFLIPYNNLDGLTQSPFDRSRRTIFLSHGYTGDGNLPWLIAMKNSLLKSEDANVLILDWRKAARIPYIRAVANMRVVGGQTKELLENMKTLGVNMKDVHLVGFSLGAHLFGEVGRLMHSTIGRITGLDPAGPHFEYSSKDFRLDKSDAIFVDVVHTNGDRLHFPSLSVGVGISRPSGHVDFLVNGGERQPGCTLGFFSWITKRGDLKHYVSCSHNRALHLYIESITSNCAFTAHSCSSYEEFKQGRCQGCSRETCNIMGYRTDPSRAQGVLYLDTNPTKPFCIAGSTV